MAARGESLRLVENNVALVRLSLALFVCVGHAAQLSGQDALAPLASALAWPYRVSAFFVLSGFLIFRSYERSSSLASYARRRALRIYPMYALVVLACAVGLGLVSRVPAGEYFSMTWLRYVAANLSFLGFVQPTLPGVFEQNVRPEINGALWTLKIEVMFYAVVPLFAWLFARAGRRRVMAATYGLSIAYAALMLAMAGRGDEGTIYRELARQLPGQLSFLMTGAFAYYYLEFVERHVAAIAAAAVAVLVFADALPLLAVLQPMALGAVVIVVSLFTPVIRVEPPRTLSYALFLVHFPVTQLFVHVGWMTGSPIAFVVCVTGVSLACAAALDSVAGRLEPTPSRAAIGRAPAPAEA